MSDSIVRASCPTCGDVVLTTGDLGLEMGDVRSRFLFACPRCHQRVSREVPSGIIHILLAAGVHPIPVEPEPIGEEEMAAFLAEFDRPDYLDALRRLGA